MSYIRGKVSSHLRPHLSNREDQEGELPGTSHLNSVSSQGWRCQRSSWSTEPASPYWVHCWFFLQCDRQQNTKLKTIMHNGRSHITVPNCIRVLYQDSRAGSNAWTHSLALIQTEGGRSVPGEQTWRPICLLRSLPKAAPTAVTSECAELKELTRCAWEDSGQV